MASDGVPSDMDGQESQSSQVSPSPASAMPRSSCRLKLDGRLRWALTSCAHCRDYKHSTCVLTCYGKVAHHREVVLVNDEGVRSSIGVLSDGQGPPATGMLGRTVVLDQSAVDNGVICTVSCTACAGLPLGGCIDAGHEQQVCAVALWIIFGRSATIDRPCSACRSRRDPTCSAFLSSCPPNKFG